MEEVQVLLAPEDADLMPKRQHESDAAFDLRSRVALELLPGKRAAVPTGVRLGLPEGYVADVRPRSGLALKHGITVLNTPGTIDAGYRGEVQVILINLGEEPFVIARGDRIAQMLIQRLDPVVLVPATELSDSDRGEGGFGSTGRK